MEEGRLSQPQSDADRLAVIEMASRLALRARGLQSLAGAIEGGFYGLCLAAVFALLQPLFFSLPALAVVAGPAALVAASALAGAAAGALRKQDESILMIRADHLLGSHDLLSTAYQRLSRKPPTLFDQAVMADAALLIPSLEIRRAVSRPKLRTLKLLPFPLLAVILLTLVPIRLSDNLLTPAARREAERRSLARELEDLQKQVERQAMAQGAPGGVELAMEVHELAQDVQSGAVSQEAALRRLSELRRQSDAARETDPDEPEEPTEPSRGSSGSSGDKTPQEDDGKDAAGGTGENQSQKGDTVSPKERPEEEVEESNPSAYESSGEEAVDRQGESAISSVAGRPTEDPQSRTEKESDIGGGGKKPEGDVSRTPGDKPVEDEKGPPTPIRLGSSVDPMAVEVPQKPADTLKTIVRALPSWREAGVPEEQVVRQYTRQAEGALAREDIPPGLRRYVKDYFIVISMIEGEE